MSWRSGARVQLRLLDLGAPVGVELCRARGGDPRLEGCEIVADLRRRHAIRDAIAS